ncbi:hypothetical protein [Persephonella sp.]
MKWIKKDLIFSPKKFRNSWIYSHAYIPTPYFISENVIRIFVAFWDKEKVGRIGFVDIDAENPQKILRVSEKPSLDIGEPGTFDDNGIAPVSIVDEANHIRLYYFGFQICKKIRYYLLSGLAVSKDRGVSFKRLSKTPILERSNDEYFLRSAPFVLKENNLYKMWYVAGSEWIEVNGKQVPKYNIRYLESKDGINWGEKGIICIDFQNDDEHGFGRPWILKDGNLYRMFYSIRTRPKGYRLGYAESKDGINWIRKDDEIGIDVSEEGWDSKTICFSAVVRYKDRVYMFYNGNNFGEDGFGYAILEHW